LTVEEWVIGRMDREFLVFADRPYYLLKLNRFLVVQMQNLPDDVRNLCSTTSFIPCRTELLPQSFAINVVGHATPRVRPGRQQKSEATARVPRTNRAGVGYLGTAVDKRQSAPGFNGVWAREFSGGLAISNPKGNGTQTVTLSQLGISSSSTWHRINGTQASIVNNGAAVSLTTPITVLERDGLILLRN
jgi:hypothetical protein